MSRPAHTYRRFALPAIATAVALAVTAVALADVAIYRNDFSRKGEFREISKARGKGCNKGYREKTEVMRVNFQRGNQACSFRVPVRADGAVPDHIFQMRAKVNSNTVKRIRDKAYLGIALRVGGGDSYELRVFPKTGRYQLRRSPDGAGFPVAGISDAVKGINKRNLLRLSAKGSRVQARVNGTEVADVDDADPGELQGTRVEFLLGSTANADRKVEGVFDDLRLSVPNP